MSLMRLIKDYIPTSTKMDIIRCKESLDRILHGRKKITSSYTYKQFRNKGVHTFFGYYDITPFNPVNNDILYLEYTPSKKTAKIIRDNIEGGQRRVITSTNACNWQQGCRLRWLPNDSSKVIFNDFVDGDYISRIIDVNNGTEERLNMPLYDISPDGSIGITLDFTRLGYMRPGYGYINLPFKEADESMLNEGVDIVDLGTKQIIKTVTYQEMGLVMGKKPSTVKNWYLNHLSFSPNGKKFLFFFLEKLSETQFTASMMCYDIEKNQLKCLEPELKNSHYTWMNNDTILCTAYTFLKDRIKCGYYLYDTVTCERAEYCPQSLTIDGHPSRLNEEEIITDTYPDVISYQYIYKVNGVDDKKETLIQVFNRTADCAEQRTDLHPRLNRDHTLICFDANIDSHRSMFVLKIK